MITRLFQLTIVKGSYYHSLSEENRIREIVIEAKRGKIVDRKGYTLVENSDVEVTESLKRIVSKRYYKEGEAFSHVLGYRQIADKNDIGNDSCLHKLKLGDKTGKKGIEGLYDCELRGINGKKLIEVDAQGEFKRTLNVAEPVPGKTIHLAIDSDLQKRAFEVIKDKKGVVAAMDPRTGEVLVLTSSPSFNPQEFEDNNSEVITALLKDEDRPLFNRGTEGTYPPGSVFKPVVAAAALEEDAVTRDTTVQDTGKVELGNREFGTWNFIEHGKTEGDVDIIKSLQRSNDIYYYKISEKLGPEKIKKWAEKFGYQSKSGLGIDEVIGTIPSPFWKQDVIKEQWYTGDSYNLSIGQGYVLATPLQVTLATVPFANGGKLCKPRLLKMGSPYAPKAECAPVGISEETLAIVREGMLKACEVGGTGWPLFNFRVRDYSKPMPTPTVASGSANMAKLSPTAIPVEKLWDPTYLLASNSAMLAYTKPIQLGCKTGTAESMPGHKPHAWFTVFAPYDNPEIVITVMLEEAGQGSDMAAPVAREVLKTYFERNE